MSSSNTHSFKGQVFQVTTSGNNENVQVTSLNGNKVVTLFTDISGVYKSAKVAEIDVSTGAILCLGNIGPSNKHVRAGSLLKYDANKYIVSWTQDNGDQEGYIGAYSNCLALKDAEKLESTNDYNVAKVSLARLQGNEFITIWDTIRYQGDHNHYRIRGEIYELKSDNDIYKHKTLSMESDSQDIHDQSVVASFSSGKSIAVWREEKGNNNEIRAELFYSSGNSVSADWEVSQGNDQFSNPSVATINDRAFVVWYKETGSSKGIYGRLINENNNPIGNQIYISNVSNSITQLKVIVVDNKFLVHWHDNDGRIFVKVFDSEGSFVNKECKILDNNIGPDNYSASVLSDNAVVYSWSENSQVYVGTKKVSKICDITNTETKTESFSLSPSSTESSSLTSSASISTSASVSETHSKSESISGSDTLTNTGTLSQTQSVSDTTSRSESLSSSLSTSASDTVSATKTETTSGSISGTGSQTTTVSKTKSVSDTGSYSQSDSVSGTKTGTETSSVTATGTETVTRSGTKTDSGSTSTSVSGTFTATDSIPLTQTQTITLKCGKDVHGRFKDKILLDVRIENIKVTNVDTSNPQLYTQHTTQKHSNSGRSNINEQIKLSIKDESKDYIDNFQERVINPNYIINGTVSYSNNVLNTELVNSDPNIIQTERVNCQRDDYTSYDLLHDNLRFHGINKCEYNVINDQKEIVLRPKECSITSMTATFNKNVKVSYDADLIISARNKFNGKAADDELQVITECLLLPNISWQFVNDGKQIKAPISGSITHTALKSITLDRADCEQQLPYVNANLVYKDFQLTEPTNLDQYIVRYSNSKDYVNTNRYGDINVNAHLSLNIPLTGSTEGFNRDIKSTQFVKTGKVTYLNEKFLDAFAYRNGDVSGYQFRDSQPLEYEIFSLPNKIPTSSFTSWDNLNVGDNINFLVVPNGCKKAAMEAFVYKDVPVGYTAKGYLSLKDENGRVISGPDLESSSSYILNPQFSLEREEAVFSISGTMTHNIVKNFTIYTEDCASKHQSLTALPEVIVSLTYSDYIFTQPSVNDFNQKLKTYTAGQSFINNKKYGTTQAQSSVRLEVKLSKSLNSHYNDIKQNDLVKDGTVQYIRNFNDIQNLYSNDRSGYKLDTMGDVITQSWFSSGYKVSSGVTSAWNKLNAEATFTENIVPGQCIDVNLVASVYEGVRVEYAAKGYFTAKTLDGRSIQGEELLNVAQMVINKEDITLNSNGEAVFSTGGFLEHSFIAGVTSNSSDCNH